MNTAASASLVPIGVRYMLLSALGFALMAVCVKAVSLQGIPVLEIVAARSLVSLLISYVDVKRKGISMWGERHALLTARGVVGTVALICVYYSVSTLPLAEATILQYLYPLFTALLALIFLNERIQRATALCLLLSITGLIVIVRPEFLFGGTMALPTLSVGAALVGALGSAIAYVFVRRLSQSEDSSVIILYFPLIALPVSLTLIVMQDAFVMPSLSTLV
ncbi:MAG: DMT family transporter, partial [Amphritea sp.]|nr:DMT family transporter [Amphritea sp.]